MCWVIPPRSFSAILLLRMKSSKVVLPWSTCPMIVTTVGRVRVFFFVVSVLVFATTDYFPRLIFFSFSFFLARSFLRFLGFFSFRFSFLDHFLLRCLSLQST